MKITPSSLGGTLVRLTAILLFLSSGTQQAVAATKSQTLEQCLDTGNGLSDDQRRELAEEVAGWPKVYSPLLAEPGVECLENNLSGEWRYSLELQKFTQGAASKEEQQIRALSLRKEEAQRTVDELAEIKETDEYRELVDAERCGLLDEFDRLKAQIASAEAGIASAEEGIENRRQGVHLAVVQECYDWFSQDRRGALTNGVCKGVFEQYGFLENAAEFDTLIAALAKNRAVLALSRSELELATRKLAVLEDNEMLLDDWLRYADAWATLIETREVTGNSLTECE